MRACWFYAVLRMSLLILLAAILAPVAPAQAHAFLESSDPSANAVVPSAPSSMVLRFTESLESSYSRAELFDQSGAVVPGVTSTVGTDQRSMTATIPPGLPNGTYSIQWRTLSNVDGHTAQGYIPFTIGTAADVRSITAPVVEATGGPLPEWAGAVARWLALLGLAALVAIWPGWI
jgi:copper transport protein